jgi:hypothetical protein
MATRASYVASIPNSDLGARLKRLQTRIAGRFRLGLYSRTVRFGLRRDLGLAFEKPSAKISLAIRPLRDGDVALLLSMSDAGDRQDELEIARRRAFLEKAGKGCFVAVDVRNDTPCYMQWLMSSSENGLIQRLGGFPELATNEALLENAYTPFKYRGLGIMSAAMALIAERAAEFGARYVLTFVDDTNIASLKGCERAGFYPHLLHHRVQLGFGLLRWDRFEILSEGDSRRNFRFYPVTSS